MIESLAVSIKNGIEVSQRHMDSLDSFLSALKEDDVKEYFGLVRDRLVILNDWFKKLEIMPEEDARSQYLKASELLILTLVSLEQSLEDFKMEKNNDISNA